jgi:hypothetical protein
VQVDPFRPTLNAPGPERLKLNYDELLSSFAFNFNLRRYSEGRVAEFLWIAPADVVGPGGNETAPNITGRHSSHNKTRV